MSKEVKRMNDVASVLENIKLDAEKFEVIRKFDNEEFDELSKERRAYANIREVISKRSVVKLWGHNEFVTVECSKMLRKKEQINVDKKVYTEKALDKNHNYMCDTEKKAIALAQDFINQVDKMLTESVTVTEKKEELEKAN